MSGVMQMVGNIRVKIRYSYPKMNYPLENTCVGTIRFSDIGLSARKKIEKTLKSVRIKIVRNL